MTVHVEPQPLHESLHGGAPGARVVVEPLIAGHVDFPEAAMVSPGGRFLTLRIARAITRQAAPPGPGPAFLIRHPSAGAILVDTGLHPSIATDGRENLGGTVIGTRSRRSSPAKTSPRSCASAGSTGEIPIVLMTHLHLDHTSAISEFPNSTFVVSEAEWEAAATWLPTADQRLPPGTLRLRLRLPRDRLRPRRDRLLCQLRADLRPLRRRLDPARLHPGAQRRPHVVVSRLAKRDFVIGGDAVYMGAQLGGARHRRHAPPTRITCAAPCRS